jgi:hypothetical protein
MFRVLCLTTRQQGGQESADRSVAELVEYLPEATVSTSYWLGSAAS